MSIKQKFESIDQSQLSENQKEILGKIKTATKDFTITDQKALDKVDSALDNIITKLKATNPQAIKVEAKKQEPKAKKEVVKKEPKSETKKPKKAKKEAGGKRTIFSIAKEIRKADESWEDAKARAKKVMETEKKDTTKKMKSETDKLLAFIKRRKELEGLSGTSVKKDSKIEALPKGRRISKKGWKNQYGESEGGRVYYENRDNRTDRLAPSFDDKIYLADGGAIENQYEGRTPEDIWNNLNTKQKLHFVYDHFPHNSNELKESLKEIGYKWKSLSNTLKDEFQFHVREGQYAYGGKTKSRPSMREFYIEQIAFSTNTRKEGVDAFAKDHNLTDAELSNLMTGIGRKMISQSDFITALVGNKNNTKQKEVVAFAKSDKAYKMAYGGDVLPPSKTYGENIYKAMQKFNISDSEARKRYGQFTINQWNELLEEKMAYGGGVEEIYFFQCKNKEIRDDFFEDLQSYMPDHYKIKMGDLGIQLNASPNDEENLQQMANSTDGVFLVVEKYADGGTIIGTPETPLARGLGISYTGLVGETGAMSSGEMFMDGGSTGLPAGAEQQFVNYYLGEGASAGIFEQGGSLVDGYLTDPNFGDFQAGIYAEGGSLGNHGLKQGDQIIKTMSGGVQKVKTRTGDIVYVNLANGYRGAEPPLPFDKGGRTRERRFLNHGQNYEVRYAKDKPKRRGYGYADGGTIIGTPETPLARDLGISYTGLVGETGAMSSGEMFADGGTIDAFQMRTVRGVDNKPTEVLTDEQKVQFAKGGSIKNEDIKVGEEFLLSNGDVIEIVRLFKENIDEDWVEYKRNGDKKENSVKELRLFINRLGGKKQKSWRERRNEYLERLGQEESKVWDKIGAESGSEIRNDEKMLRAYAEGVQEMLQKEGVGKGAFDQEDYDFYTDENWHLFNEFLVWNGYYDPEMTKTEKAWREDRFKDPKYRNYVSNPKIISLSGGSKSKSTNYIPKGKIATITIVKDGKEMVFLPSQVLNGVNLYKGGGKIKNDYVYIAKRYVKEVHYDDGKDLKVVKPSNGYWVKKSALKSFKQKFEGGGKTTFKEKSTAIAKNFEGKKVKPKYQKEYGKVYDKAEAKEVGNKIAGSQKAKYDSKMSGGGTTKRGGAMVLAKQIRKDGESWASALKRANEQMRKK